jgi:hypothetical protein
LVGRVERMGTSQQHTGRNRVSSSKLASVALPGTAENQDLTLPGVDERLVLESALKIYGSPSLPPDSKRHVEKQIGAKLGFESGEGAHLLYRDGKGAVFKNESGNCFIQGRVRSAEEADQTGTGLKFKSPWPISNQGANVNFTFTANGRDVGQAVLHTVKDKDLINNANLLSPTVTPAVLLLARSSSGETGFVLNTISTGVSRPGREGWELDLHAYRDGEEHKYFDPKNGKPIDTPRTFETTRKPGPGEGRADITEHNFVWRDSANNVVAAKISFRYPSSSQNRLELVSTEFLGKPLVIRYNALSDAGQ